MPRAAPQVRLRLLSTTDLHGTIWPHDYEADRATSGRGLAALAPVIRNARAEVPQSLLFDTGDMLQGSALADLAARDLRGTANPVIVAMNTLGYDAAALGNHDFNFGLDPLETAIGQARFPMLCANLVRALGTSPLDDHHFAPPSAMLDRALPNGDGRLHRLRIGVIGAAPPQTAQWDSALLGRRIVARGIVEAVAAHARALRAQGADLIVVLSHSGIGTQDDGPGAEDASRAVADLPDVDVVLAGHSHRRLTRIQDGADENAGEARKPLVMAGAFGSDLGIVDLDLAHDDGAWRVTAARTELRPASASTDPPEPAILSATRGAHSRTRAAMDAVVGRTRSHLHGLFPFACHAPVLQFLAEAKLARGRRLVDDTPLADLPLLAAAAPFSAGGLAGPMAFVDIPPGLLRKRHLLQISPFPNRLCVLEVTGRQLRDWLERAASNFLTVPDGAYDAPLVDPATAGYNFDVIFGVEYVIDLSRPARFGAADGVPCDLGGPGRIIALSHDGRPVADTDRFALATTSYRAAGGGGYRIVPAHAPRCAGTETMHEILTGHVAASREITLTPRPAWSFAPLAASAIVESAPHACLDLHGDPSRRLEPLAVNASGFSRFRLHL